ncbi:hypothetical protein EDB85DRAFT_1930358 [Lactarius pseudohatsudake]|nr:hypothetical protein EDB85DRAFT_1930358 [Lactarius pseudohatsudake]
MISDQFRHRAFVVSTCVLRVRACTHWQAVCRKCARHVSRTPNQRTNHQQNKTSASADALGQGGGLFRTNKT